MAKLPTEVELGGVSSLQSGRPIADYDTTPYARGAAAEAAGVAEIGKGLTSAGQGVGIAARHEQLKDDQFETARAKADFLVRKSQHDQSFKDDIDHDTLPKRYSEGLRGIAEESGALITSPRAKKMFGFAIADDVARGEAAAATTANALWKDRTQADVMDKLTGLREAALKDPDPESAAGKVQTGNDLITSLVDKKIWSATEGVQKRKEWAENYGKSWLTLQDAPTRARLTAPAPQNLDQTIDRIISPNVEGTAKNPNSSAFGTGQFIKDTWFETLKKHGPPEIANKITFDGKRYAAINADEEQTILALRSDKNLGRAMTKAYAEDNAKFLQSVGLEATPGNVYLAHFLGPKAAISVLKADPNAPVANIVGKAAVEANVSVLQGKTAGSVVEWASGKMGGQGGRTGTPADFVSTVGRAIIYQQSKQQVDQSALKESAANAERYERMIIDAGAGKVPLIDRATIENDPGLNDSVKNTLLRQHGAAVESTAAYDRGVVKLGEKDSVWNPRDEADQKSLSAVDVRSGVVAGLQANSPEAAGIAVHRFSETGMVSNDVKGSLEGMVRGGNDKQLQYAMSTLDAMYRRNPNAFAEAFNKDTAKILSSWQSKADWPSGAFRDQLKRANDPSTVKAREAAEKDGREIIMGKGGKDGLSDRELLSALDDSWLSDPVKPIGSRDAPGLAVYREQYADLYAEGYAANDGDKKAAKDWADARIKIDWAVSKSGGGRVMKHAPETLPESVFPSVRGNRNWMQAQVEEAVYQRLGLQKPDPITGESLTPEIAPPVYGLVALPETRSEIETVKAGRPLPNGRKSPNWALVYLDPKTGLHKQELFYFDVNAARNERAVEDIGAHLESNELRPYVDEARAIRRAARSGLKISDKPERP